MIFSRTRFVVIGLFTACRRITKMSELGNEYIAARSEPMKIAEGMFSLPFQCTESLFAASISTRSPGRTYYLLVVRSAREFVPYFSTSQRTCSHAMHSENPELHDQTQFTRSPQDYYGSPS